MSSDRDLLIDLLAQAYKILLAYGVHNSTNPDRVLLMDEIKLELEMYGADQPPACANCGGSGIIRWQAYDGTEEGHEEQDPCPVCASSKSSGEGK